MPIYIVGIGPGDPEMITLKAEKIIKSADICFVPEGQELFISTVGFDGRKVVYGFNSADSGSIALQAAEYSDNGRTAAYLVTGDGTVFSTAAEFAGHLDTIGQEYTFISGISSFIAAANAAKFSLAEGRGAFTVAALPDSAEQVAQRVGNGTAVFMRLRHNIKALVDYVDGYRPEYAVIVNRASMSGESIIPVSACEKNDLLVDELSIAIIRA